MKKAEDNPLHENSGEGPEHSAEHEPKMKAEGEPAAESESRSDQGDAPEAAPTESGQALAELNDKYLRLVAEFDNFRKRTARERSDLLKHASEDIMKALLEVLDDIERASAPEAAGGAQEVLPEGVRLIFSKLSRILTGKGLKPMESKGQPFDAELHEAIAEVPAPQPESAGKVLDVVQTGYFLNDKIIRHAKVVVGK